MNIALNIPLALGLAISFAACEGGGAATSLSLDKSSASAEAADKSKTQVAPRKKRRSTSPRLALANLNGQINAAKMRVERFPNDIVSRTKLVDLLLARTQFLGSYDDFDTAFEVVEDALKRELSPARTALLHAQVLSAVHRFKEASAELDRAEKLGSERTQPLRQTIALATGEGADQAHQRRVAAAEQRPNYSSLTKLAASLTVIERYEDADAAYAQALDSYRDVSPFPMAWVAFQRGVIWGERADDAERAYQQYQIAVERLPQYVVGNVHLSELEIERGARPAAIARLEGIVHATQDPEPASRLAQYLEESSPSRAAVYREQARSGYETLLGRYPLAFADHATEFYLGAGADPERALTLALMNLENRKTPRAYRLVAEAASAAKRASAVKRLKGLSPELHKFAASL